MSLFKRKFPASTETLPPALRDARKALDAARAAREKLDAAFDNARSAARTREAEHAASGARLSATESDNAIGTLDNDELEAARAAFTESRDSVQFAVVRVAGLEAKLVIADGVVGDAKRNLDGAWTAHLAAKIEQIHAEYDAAAAQLMNCACRATVLGAAANDRRLYLAMRRLQIPESANSPTIFRQLAYRDGWKQDEAATALHDSLEELRRAVFGEPTSPEPLPPTSVASESTLPVPPAITIPVTEATE